MHSIQHAQEVAREHVRTSLRHLYQPWIIDGLMEKHARRHSSNQPVTLAEAGWDLHFKRYRDDVLGVLLGKLTHAALRSESAAIGLAGVEQELVKAKAIVDAQATTPLKRKAVVAAQKTIDTAPGFRKNMLDAHGTITLDEYNARRRAVLRTVKAELRLAIARRRHRVDRLQVTDFVKAARHASTHAQHRIQAARTLSLEMAIHLFPKTPPLELRTIARTAGRYLRAKPSRVGVTTDRDPTPMGVRALAARLLTQGANLAETHHYIHTLDTLRDEFNTQMDQAKKQRNQY